MSLVGGKYSPIWGVPLEEFKEINDNRVENLRILCPNCHSQTDTFCAKNIKKSSTLTIIFGQSQNFNAYIMY